MNNPFYWLDIRIRASEKRMWIIALFFLLSILLIGGGLLLTALVERYWAVIPGELGRVIIYTLIFWQLAVLVVLAPLAAAGRISQEREQRTLPALINTSVNPVTIVWGKLLGAWMFIFWLSAFVFPFLGIGFFWGGVSPAKLLALVAINVVISMTIAAVALGFSGLMRRSLTAYLVTGAFLLGWMAVLPMLGGITMAIHSSLSTGYKTEIMEEVIAFVFFYHNPLFPIILIIGGDIDFTAAQAAGRIAYCFAVWAFLACGGILMAQSGLKKEVY